MSSLTARTRSIPPEMLLDIAAGMEDPVDIAYRYGFSASEFKKLEQSQQFLSEVATLRSKHERSGEAAVAKAGMMYDVLAEKYFLRLMDNEATTSQLAAGVEAFATLGNRKPKAATSNVQGAQFSITFNIPNAVNTQATTIDMKSAAVERAEKLVASLPTFDYTDVTTEEDEPDGEPEV
jgi:hypothetical protein